MINQDLMERAKSGTITQSELAKIAVTLETSPPTLDLYPLLYAIGRSLRVRYRDVVERFLDCESEPDLARLALQILCSFWGDTKRYLGHVKRFAYGVFWDDEEQVRLMAIAIAGEYLRENRDRDLLEHLVSFLEDCAQSRFVREDAYCAIARAMGREWKDLPSAAKHFDLQKETDSKVVLEVRKRLAREARRPG